MRTISRRISASTPGRTCRPLRWVHFRAINCRCHRRIVSGVTIVATWRNTRRPSRCPRMASRHRSSSLSRRRRPWSCFRRTRFSTTRYDTVSCWRRSSHPFSAASSMRRRNASTTAGRSTAVTELTWRHSDGPSNGTLRSSNRVTSQSTSQSSTSNRSMSVRLPCTLLGDPSIAHRAQIRWLMVSTSKHQNRGCETKLRQRPSQAIPRCLCA